MIYIILPVYNRVKYTLNFIESINSNDVPFKLIVIDDGSTDNTSDLIKSQFSDVIVLNGDGNLWWTESINTGIRYVFDKFSPQSGDYILTINNDLLVEFDFLSNLLALSLKFPKSMIGCLSVDLKNPTYLSYCGSLWNSHTAKRVDIAATKYQNSLIKFNEENNNIDYVATDLLPGRGVLYPISLIHDIGYYDSKTFPQYAADHDFSLRAKQSGYDLIISTKAVVYSYIDETGVYHIKTRDVFRWLWARMTSIKSPVNLKTRFRWSKKHAPRPIIHFTLDLLRVTKGNIKRLIR